MVRPTRWVALAAGLVAGMGCRAEPACTAEIDDDVPTVVHVRWSSRSSETWHVEYGTGASLDRSTPVETGPAGDRDVLLLGLPALTEVAVRVVTTDGREERTCETTITTHGLDADTPGVVTSELDPDRMDGFRFLVAAVMGDEAGIVVFDRAGERVWYRTHEEEEQIADVHPDPDGDGLRYNVFSIDRATDVGRVEHVGFDGTLLETIDTPLAHHVFSHQDDGTVAWLAADVRSWYDEATREQYSVVGDAILELRPGSPAPVTVWSSWSDFEPTPNPEWESGFYPFGEDWTHANTLRPVPGRHAWTTALAHLNAVLEIDRRTGDVVHQYGGAAGYFVPAPSFPIHFPHDAHITENDTLLLISSEPEIGETRAVEYAIDHQRRELHEIWSYGRDQGLYATALGQAIRLANGNTLVNFGTQGIIREVTPDGVVVWEAATGAGTWFAQVQPIDDFYGG